MQYTIDATNKKLGRLASEIAVILQGKKNPKYEPRLSGTDTVVVTNVKKLALVTKKSEKKIYYRHTGYMGHLKSTTFKEAFAKNPEKVLRNVVAHMLPKNRLQRERMRKLKIQ